MFDVAITFVDSTFELKITTDLPTKTKVHVVANRTFPSTDNHSWYWTILDETPHVARQIDGTHGIHIVRTIDELDTKGMHGYRYLKGRMPVEIAGRPTELVELKVDVSHFVTGHKFGICNRQLTGRAVLMEKGGHVIHHSATLNLPLSKRVMSLIKQ